MINSVHAWIRGAKTCSLTQKELGALDFYYSALIETAEGLKRLDFHPDAFFVWKQSSAFKDSVSAWWKVYKEVKKERLGDSYQLVELFGAFYEKYSKEIPSTVLRLAYLLRKMKKIEIDLLDSGQWRLVFHKAALENLDEEGVWLLDSCRLTQEIDEQKKENEMIRLFFADQL